MVVQAWDELGQEDRERLRDLRADPDFFGIASVPRQGESMKAIDGATAMVLADLRAPAPLPERARALLADDGKPLLRLVLDDFLQVDSDSGFVGGPAALELLPELRVVSNSLGALAELSDLALRHATTVRVNGVDLVAERLYGFNTAPESPRLRAKFASASSVAHALRLVQGTRLANAIAERWTGPPRLDYATWWAFDVSAPAMGPNERLRFKIYLSPRIDFLARALDVAIPILRRHGCPAFKMGGTLHQLLRPDKFVAYFADRAQMLDAAAVLADVMSSLPGQGVPFSAPVNEAAIVSWGIDPPADAKPLSWQERDSWRSWVTQRLARYLVISRHSTTQHLKPWEFARARLELDGVDTERWTPSGTRWDHPESRAALRVT